MSRAKELSVYACMLCIVIISTLTFNASSITSKNGVAEVVENPQLTWINDRLPTQTDCDNRTGLLWVYNGGLAKIRFYHNVKEGQWWATIKRPMGPREKWIDNIVDAVEENHCHEPI